MEKYILRLSHSLFEPVKKNSGSFECTADGSRYMNVEACDEMYVRFSRYIMDGEQIIGVRLWCDYGHGYGFHHGTGYVEMKPGEQAHFSYEGTSVDDEGDPENFSIDYYLELYNWDNALLKVR